MTKSVAHSHGSQATSFRTGDTHDSGVSQGMVPHSKLLQIAMAVAMVVNYPMVWFFCVESGRGEKVGALKSLKLRVCCPNIFCGD